MTSGEAVGKSEDSVIHVVQWISRGGWTTTRQFAIKTPATLLETMNAKTTVTGIYLTSVPIPFVGGYELRRVQLREILPAC
jgi:hypothetical protein